MLTDAKCRNANSGDKSIRKLADGGGLYLWVYSDGRKYWRLRYWREGKEKSLSLGVYPAVGLKDARQKLDIERKRLDGNLDPSAERRAEKLRRTEAATNSFEAVALEWYGKQLHTWVPSHALDVKRRLEGNVFPKMGNRPISEIEPPELLEIVRPIEKRGAHDLAHRVVQVCGQVFRYGVATGRCKRDVSRDLRGALTPHEKRHQPAVRPEELPDLLRAIAGYEEHGDLQTRLALDLMTLSFIRTNELICAEWIEFDLDAGIWIVPAERMKLRRSKKSEASNAHLVPLSKNRFQNEL